MMQSALEYLSTKNEVLKYNYRSADGRYSESCSVISVNLAERLLAEGKEPFIVRFSEDVHEKDFSKYKVLKPLAYGGRVTWTAHIVCCADGLAYDPVIGKPVPIEAYSKVMFGEEIGMTVEVPSIKIRDFLNR